MNIEQSNKLVGNYGEFLKYSDIFCETGSCYGRSIELALSAGYKFVSSVEAKEEYYLHCKNLFKDNLNVKLYHGMSVEHLKEMLENYTTPCVIFLDAHVSGEASAGYKDWVEKQSESEYDQDRILKQELQIILQNSKKHVIIIDDQNGLNEYTQGYLDIFQSHEANYKFEFWDEQMGNMFYKDKMLVCLPS